MRYSTALLPAVITTGTINFLNAKATLCTELHWLNVPERVVYKLCIMVYSCLHGQAPQYLVDLCLGYQSPTSLLGSISGRPVETPGPSTTPVANVRPTGFLCCWPVGLELIA